MQFYRRVRLRIILSLLCVAAACLCSPILSAQQESPANQQPEQPKPQPPKPEQPKRTPSPFETVPEAAEPPKPVAPKPEPGQPAAPKAQPGQPAENVIEAIEFRGSRRVPQDTLRALILTKRGDNYDEDTLRRDFMALWNTGRFDDIRLEREAGESGWVIRFNLVERRVVRTIK
jgi:outer membrane protein insertion porin family